MNVLDLFSGIGGFSLGLERAGMRTVAFCEIEPYCRAVLRKHWPDVPCYDDIRTLTAERLAADGIAADVICGGFPCQDISVAGKGAGIEGERSGLWAEYARLIGEIRPQYVIVENVAALLGRGLSRVLGDLASLGYDAEWHCIPASYVGAPHRRDRLWIVAYPKSARAKQDNRGLWQRTAGVNRGEAADKAVANAPSERCGEAREHSERYSEWASGSGELLADAQGVGSQRIGTDGEQKSPVHAGERLSLRNGENRFDHWAVEPDVGRVANGVPARVDRLRCLGNSVVPQVVQAIGEAIMNTIRRPDRTGAGT